MQEQPNLLSLPDLVLHHICTLIICPLDLINFGSTCSKLYKFASSRNIWWHAIFRWCKGLWPWIEIESQHKHPHQWLLELMKYYTTPPPGTDLNCKVDVETWERVDSPKFRCLVGMLRISYGDQQKDNHPGVLFKRWLFDIGLYKRVSRDINFAASDFQLSYESCYQLSTLGQAKDRDLRARKQPHLNPKYYVKKISVSQENWLTELFPSGPNGSLCPLLICPFGSSFCSEVSGMSGLTMCLSLVLEDHLRPHCLSKNISPSEMLGMIKLACRTFVEHFTLLLPQIVDTWGHYSLKTAIQDMAAQGNLTLESWQSDLNKMKVRLDWKTIICDISAILGKYEGIDNVVDSIRRCWRHALLNEINMVLFQGRSVLNPVTRINITDSDRIGGDNPRQEMSAAAFIADFGVLVTWQLTGCMRY